MTFAIDEAIEVYADTAKDLVKKWRQYGTGVATKLDSGYDADSAAADLGAGISLAIETGVRLTWDTLDAITTLVDAPDKPHFVESDECSAPKGAKLTLETELTTRTGETLPARSTMLIPGQLGPGDTKFRVRADAAAFPAGVYRGIVSASIGDKPEKVEVLVKVP